MGMQYYLFGKSWADVGQVCMILTHKDITYLDITH